MYYRCCYFFAEEAKAWVGVVRDSSGTSVWCCSSFWAGYKDPMVAEGMAIREMENLEMLKEDKLLKSWRTSSSSSSSFVN
ncbi:hypothetical protein PVK06_030549 [Gossypium arboreum]|uniref:RNase H type-1 domain-containing protein n=1 Tax=Gossypium arboreum TaxID=29729 RepID=A0ABR0NNL4_GOSAR|nr:hypothetical protein PVK06_030549 [Gossypium arboreum]